MAGGFLFYIINTVRFIGLRLCYHVFKQMFESEVIALKNRIGITNRTNLNAACESVRSEEEVRFLRLLRNFPEKTKAAIRKAEKTHKKCEF